MQWYASRACTMSALQDTAKGGSDEDDKRDEVHTDTIIDRFKNLLKRPVRCTDTVFSGGPLQASMDLAAGSSCCILNLYQSTRSRDNPTSFTFSASGSSRVNLEIYLVRTSMHLSSNVVYDISINSPDCCDSDCCLSVADIAKETFNKCAAASKRVRRSGTLSVVRKPCPSISQTEAPCDHEYTLTCKGLPLLSYTQLYAFFKLIEPKAISAIRLHHSTDLLKFDCVFVK